MQRNAYFSIKLRLLWCAFHFENVNAQFQDDLKFKVYCAWMDLFYQVMFKDIDSQVWPIVFQWYKRMNRYMEVNIYMKYHMCVYHCEYNQSNLIESNVYAMSFLWCLGGIWYIFIRPFNSFWLLNFVHWYFVISHYNGWAYKPLLTT